MENNLPTKKEEGFLNRWIVTLLLVAAFVASFMLLSPEIQPRQVAIILVLSALALGIGVSIFRGKER